MVKELKDVADIQKDFIEGLLEDIAPPELAGQINALQIDPDFVDRLIRFDPTKSNQIGLPRGKVFDVFKDTTSMQAVQSRFALTAGVGKEIVLPNGDVVAKAFRGLTERTADRFAHTVRQGLLEGRSLQRIQRQLIGTLDFNPRSAPPSPEPTKENYRSELHIQTTNSKLQIQTNDPSCRSKLDIHTQNLPTHILPTDPYTSIWRALHVQMASPPHSYGEPSTSM